MARYPILSAAYGWRTMFTKADVAVVGRSHAVILLHYWRKKSIVFEWEEAPYVLWKGAGMEGARMMEKVKSKGIPIFNHDALVDELLDLGVGLPVGAHLYHAVADLYVALMRKNEYPEHWCRLQDTLEIR